ncbi:MAG TPA: PHP domain-containing protein [Candidatus Limnocylindria bacterium]|nr:PHP domain-containing protein [Candidatus Limnocylindria bacterium]
MIKVDLHTHSIASPDGGITADQYHRALSAKLLDAIAITDHNRIDFAMALKEKLGDAIIVGEEIMTTAGEVVGLFLKELIRPGLTPQETIKQIKEQDGIVYIPHPFETIRKGIHPAVLDEIVDFVDIIEICNGRAFFQNKSEQAVVWTRVNAKIGAASSDAHGFQGLGSTYTSVSEKPTRDTLLKLLDNGIPMTGRPTMRALLYPKLNRLRKKIRSKRG